MRRLLKILIIFVFVLSSVQAMPFTYYKINLDYDKGDVNIESVGVEILYEEMKNFPGVYSANLLDYSNKALESVIFDVPIKMYYDNINPETGIIDDGGIKYLDKASFEIYIPYHSNAKYLVIFDEEVNEIIRKDISEFSKDKCGDSVCQLLESYRTCEADCSLGSKDGVCNKKRDNVCDPDCDEKDDFDCKKPELISEKPIKEEITENWYFILIILLTIFIFAFLIIKKGKKEINKGL